VRVLQRTGVSLVALVVAGMPLVAAGPASAASSPAEASLAALAPCLTNLPTARAAAEDDEDVPKWRENVDTDSVTQADLDALPAEETRKGVVAREVAPKLPSVVRIPTYVHVIKGTHRGERVPAGPKRVRNAISILNKGMAGTQSRDSAPARYRFTLKQIDYTKRDGWHHAFFNGPRDQRMKRALHRGNERTLNLYINGGGPRNEPVLGWSRFPWQYHGTPRLDHVSVNFAALPGGKATGYNRGDTLVHETGHWLGLFHTFEGGCRGDGDVVNDTPAEGEPSYYCETTRDTCETSAGLDPVRNFMDYSLDSCMNQFTPGQVRRMDAAYEKWRL
jgi:hypothetical protein